MSRIRAWMAPGPEKALEPFEFDGGELKPEEVEIAVEHCGICHSDLSVLNDEWGVSTFPLVAGHEAIGRIVALGEHAKGLQVGQRVGVGWNSSSCMHCQQCLSGNHHLCPRAQATIVGHHGAFAERLRAHWAWAVPIPDELHPATTGPLMCGGITVFSPLLLYGIRPTDRVGVVGIGGLGHMALEFLRAWGCEVTAFTSSPSKYDEIRKMGAHQVVSSRDPESIKSIKGSLNLLLVTVNVPLDWKSLIGTLAPDGRMHVVGAVLEPIPVEAFSLIGGQLQISGSPTGSPSAINTMLDFAARHRIAPLVERFPMSRINEALEHLKNGKPRFRIVLDADFG